MILEGIQFKVGFILSHYFNLMVGLDDAWK